MKAPTEFVPVSTVNPKLLKSTRESDYDMYHYGDENSSPERLLFLSENCRKLADFLIDVPDEQHNQASWVQQNHTCGTVGCAMGWAALSHVVPGLQYTINPDHTPWMEYMEAQGNLSWSYLPTINGKQSGWDKAPVAFFGQRATDDIFHNTHASKKATINALYRESQRLCNLYKKRKKKEKKDVLDRMPS